MTNPPSFFAFIMSTPITIEDYLSELQHKLQTDIQTLKQWKQRALQAQNLDYALELRDIEQYLDAARERCAQAMTEKPQ